jgi:hypothetical protein
MQPKRFDVLIPMTILRSIGKRSCRYTQIVSGRKLVLLNVMLLLAVAGMTGCKPKPAATPAPPPPVAEATNVDETTVAQADSAPAAPVSAPAAVIPAVNGQPDLGALSHSVLRWAVAHQRRPASFEEFAADPGVQIPPPPPGKKYKMERSMHVVLVDQ